ncbi:MAG: putative baseplate assembly protein [Actinoplanes sp.]
MTPAPGRHGEVLNRLLSGARRALPGLTADRPDDPAYALLDAWATMADVVAFYHDRIAREGSLGTATERLSVLEVLRSAGYELAPATPATALLAFTVEDSEDAQATVTVPAGTAVQSVPGQDEQPQTFETDTRFTAYAARNAMRLRLTGPPRIGPRSLRIAGAGSGLRPGDVLLIGGEPRLLSEVEEQAGDTVVRWEQELTPAGDEVYAFRERAALFGQNAPDWRLMPAATQRGYGAAADDPGPQWPDFDLPATRGRETTLDLGAAHPGIVPGSWIVVQGPALTALRVLGAAPAGLADFGLTATGTRLRLRGPGPGWDRRTAVVHARSEVLAPAGEPITEPVTGPELSLDAVVELAAGAPVVVTGTAVTGDAVSLPAVVAAATTGADGTTVTLTGALEVALLPETVLVLGNVVTASHGRTVEGEVLGSGSGATGHQRFTLREHEAGALEIRVDGVRWERRASLYGLGPHDRAYAVRTEDDGTTTVLFGDGECGARLPSGTENVIARYRTGAGPAGNVRAGALTLLITRPLGIRGVHNPLAATGGQPAETADDARRAGPRLVRTFGRVVSLADHENFALGFPGIAKAAAVTRTAGGRAYVHLTVAGPGGEPLPEATVSGLRAALDQAGRPGPPPVITGCRRLDFAVSATVSADPARQPGSVAAAVRAALLGTYSFARREFGRPVAASEVIAVAQRVPGVRAVILTALGPGGDVADLLVAGPTEILQADPDRVTVEEAA